MKDTEQYFPVVLFVMLYKPGITFEPVDEILECDQLSCINYHVSCMPMIQLYFFPLHS